MTEKKPLLRTGQVLFLLAVFLGFPFLSKIPLRSFWVGLLGVTLVMIIPALPLSFRLTGGKVFEAVILCFPLSWAFLPGLILFDHIFPAWLAYFAYLGGLFAAPFLVKLPRLSLGLDSRNVLVVGLVFMLLVAVPFSKFSPGNIVKELWGDGHQRFGVAHSLAQLPPENPFAAGLPLRYYWFSFYPLSFIHYQLLPDMFSVWKVFMLAQSFFFVLAIYLFLKALYPHRAVAFWSILFLFLFCSFEFFINKRLWAHALLLLKIPLSAWLQGLGHFLVGFDPDHVAGIVTGYSDQIYWEDFVYIPQNFVAVLMGLFSLFLWRKKFFVPSALVAALMVGYNTFYIVIFWPVLFVLFWLQGLPWVRIAGLFMICTGAGGLFAWMTNLMAFRLLPFFCLALLGGGLLLEKVSEHASVRKPKSKISRKALFVACLSLAALIFTRPELLKNNLVVMLANYGPAFVFLGAFVWVYRKKNLPPLFAGLFLFVGLYWLVSSFLIAGFKGFLPGLAGEASLKLNQSLNLFNFYHKVGKFVRLVVCFLGAIGLCRLFPRILRRKSLKWAFVAMLILSLPTALIRPLTYLKHQRVRQQASGMWLKHKARPQERYLTQTYENDYLHELAPVSSFYTSDWSEGNIGLTHRTGRWLDQYLPPRYRNEVDLRKNLVDKFFGKADGLWRRNFLRKYGIKYVFSLQPLEENFLLLRVKDDGQYLYEFKE